VGEDSHLDVAVRISGSFSDFVQKISGSPSRDQKKWKFM